MAEDFGDSMGGAVTGSVKQVAKTVASPVTLAGEAKDMIAASKELAGDAGAPAREHLVEKPDLTR